MKPAQAEQVLGKVVILLLLVGLLVVVWRTALYRAGADDRQQQEMLHRLEHMR